MCRSCGVDSYVFSLGKLTEAKLANFPEIECFVFVSCYATLVTEVLLAEASSFLTSDRYRSRISPS